MSEQKPIKCTCGKTIAFADDEAVYVKCTGKFEGRKCGGITKIKVSELEFSVKLVERKPRSNRTVRFKIGRVTPQMLNQRYYDHTKFE